MLFIIYEYAACLLAALIGGTLLFTASAMGVMLGAAGGMTWRRWREILAPGANWLRGRWTAEPRVP